MPPATQRRNTAYLNPPNERPAALTGLGIDLDGSVEQRFRLSDLVGGIYARLRRSGAAEPKRLGLRPARNYKKDLCGLTVELSGAHADV
jgi:hypothetical protein